MEPEIVSIENIINSCRLCLSNIDLSNIFDIYYEEHKLSDILCYCTTIQIVENDSIPSNICSKCIAGLIAVYEFIQKSCNSDRLFKSLEKDITISMNSANIDIYDAITESDVKVINSDSCEFKVTQIKSDEYDHDYGKIAHSESTSKDRANKKEHKQFQFNLYRRKRKQGSLKKLRCDICSRCFKYKHTFRQHNCNSIDEKPYHCEHCPASFNVKRNLTRHEMIHTGERPYKCDLCHKAFIQKVTLQEHTRTHTGETPYICNYCGIGLKRSKELKVHLARHSEDDDADICLEDVGNRSFSCNICKKVTVSPRALRVHQSIYHRKKSYLCSFCGKGFVAKQGLLSHTKTHTGEKPFSCEHCDKKFAYKAALRDHILIHTGEKPRVCKICDRGFVQHHHLVQHMRTHNGEKPYSCNFCGKSFALKGNLTVHVRTHTGETPYSCDVCSVAFYDSSSLKKHTMKHAPYQKETNDVEEFF